MNRVVLNNMERPYMLCVIGFLAILVNWSWGGLIYSLVISVVCVPLLMYLFIRYMLLFAYRYRHYKDVFPSLKAVYKYWSATGSGRQMWVAECANRVIGCVAIETVSPMVVELGRLSVEEEWQCMGVGGRLADYAMDHIKQRQFREVVTSAYNVNPEATNLFNKLGFKKVKSYKVFCGAGLVEIFSMKLRSLSSQNINAAFDT